MNLFRQVCGKGFLTRVDLRIHSTMHTGEKSFVCEMCGKAFARRDALRCHRRCVIFLTEKKKKKVVGLIKKIYLYVFQTKIDLTRGKGRTNANFAVKVSRSLVLWPYINDCTRENVRTSVTYVGKRSFRNPQ